MMEKYSVNPSEAYIDIDMMALKDYKIGEETFLSVPDQPEPASGRIIEIRLAEGLGRVLEDDGRQLIIENIENLEMSSFFTGMTVEHITALDRMLRRWKDLNIPLRFLDFGSNSLLLEDGDNCISFPSPQSFIFP